MDFFIGLVLLAVVILSARWVGLLPMFFPPGEPRKSDDAAGRRDRMERRMREVPDE